MATRKKAADSSAGGNADVALDLARKHGVSVDVVQDIIATVFAKNG